MVLRRTGATALLGAAVTGLVVFPVGGTGHRAAAAEAGGAVLNILTFESNDPAAFERMRRRSDADPLTLDDVRRLLDAGVGSAAVEEMVRTRRVLATASSGALAALKKAGASDDLIAAISAYALPPNRSLDLMVTLDVASDLGAGPAGGGDPPFLYIELYNVGRKEQEHLVAGSMTEILGHRWRHDEMVDTTDPLLPRRVRRIRAWGSVPLRHPGKVEVRVLLTRRPDVTHLDEVTPEERKLLQVFPIEYPEVSLRNDCELELAVVRDPMVAHAFSIRRARLFCHFD